MIAVTTDKDWVKIKGRVPPEWRGRVYTLKVRPMLDGEWFYREFLTQIFNPLEMPDAHVHSSGPSR